VCSSDLEDSRGFFPELHLWFWSRRNFIPLAKKWEIRGNRIC